MKNLKIGVLLLEGIGALISLGLGIYQIAQVVKEEKAKQLENNINKHETIKTVEV